MVPSPKLVRAVEALLTSDRLFAPSMSPPPGIETHVLSPLRNVDELAVPEPRRALAMVPVVISAADPEAATAARPNVVLCSAALASSKSALPAEVISVNAAVPEPVK